MVSTMYQGIIRNATIEQSENGRFLLKLIGDLGSHHYLIDRDAKEDLEKQLEKSDGE